MNRISLSCKNTSILDLFLDLKITIYKIITIIHLICFISSNFVIIKIFELIKINTKFSLIFVL